ncbi:MAG: DUF1579 domain-containing protein [Thermoanaerobaculia bacterium]
MNRTMRYLSVAMLVLGGAAFAQEDGAAPMDMDAMMEAGMAAANPGPQHEMLAGFAGHWNAEVQMWMVPGGEPMVSEGTVDAEMILGGRVLRETHSASMMGMPFTGIGHTGYDNISGKYWNAWMDTMGTGLYTTEGSYDEESGKLTLEGDWTNPDGTSMHVKLVSWKEGPDRRIFQMWSTIAGQTFQAMEATYTR